MSTIKRIVVVCLSLVMSVTAVYAAPARENGIAIRYNHLSFVLPTEVATNINIQHFPAEDLTVNAIGEPTHTRFVLYNGTIAPESTFDAIGSVLVYQTDDLSEVYTTQVSLLQSLLEQRPDVSNLGADTEAALPFLPVLPAGQTIHTRAAYVDLPTLSGLVYLTAFQQAAEPFEGKAFLYTFQGLSNDGKTYVSVIFPVSAEAFASFPADFDIDSFSANIEAYLQTANATLDVASADSFSIDLTLLDSLISSLSIDS